MPAQIDLGYRARPQFAAYHLRSQRWAAIVAHRRAGKTVACIMDLIDAALRSTKTSPRFAYVAPTFGQAKDVAWEYLKRFSRPLGPDVKETELAVTLPGDRRIRLYGSDNYDRMRGIYLDGVVLDEYADMDPRTWSEVVRPALSDRAGSATFIGTPKGRNAFYRLFTGDRETGWAGAEHDPDWFAARLKASETGIIPQAELKAARQMMTAEQYAAEYECDFNAALTGAYYGRELVNAETEGRLTSVPLDRAADVVAAWDLGIGDATAVWVGQLVGQEVHFIDYIESSGVGLDWYVGEIKARPYRVVTHHLPHDAEQRELTTGKTRLEYLTARGLNCEVIPRHSPEDRINAARVAFNRCWFDKAKCERGIEALRMYQEKRDEKRNVGLGPLHDWASHGADSFGYWHMAAKKVNREFRREIVYPRLGVV